MRETAGLRALSFLWQKWASVAALIRLEKQYGTLLLLFPTLWSLILASEGRPSAKHLFLFSLGAFLMRSAGCVMNDMADHKFDAQVERTKTRPLAAKQLSLQEALVILAILLSCALIVVLFLNRLTLLLSFAALFFAFIYPFAKRVTYLPQIVLGIAFSWGIILAWSAVRDELSVMPFLILLANLCWTTGYDTIYALMDRDDDVKIGVKSTAILFGENSWFAVGGLYLLFLILLAMLGRMAEMKSSYYLGVFTASLFLLFQVIKIKKIPQRPVLFSLFKLNIWVGLVVLMAFLVNYV
ncbi:4-hydroxybenzoate polyprenyltransferase [hydrothermal vent metagenome]|uniref:4-hydroxybenzoate polyprenyltransferase n=1 Tax=hydrothermal vent metagenome TaxID=652676 RepID=A0A3B1CVJ6_9ZZZZ